MHAYQLPINPSTDSIIEDVTEELGGDSASSELVHQAREHMGLASNLAERSQLTDTSMLLALLHEQRAANLLALVTLNGNAARFS